MYIFESVSWSRDDKLTDQVHVTALEQPAARVGLPETDRQAPRYPHSRTIGCVLSTDFIPLVRHRDFGAELPRYLHSREGTSHKPSVAHANKDTLCELTSSFWHHICFIC